jgi:hypothetical protein
MDQADSADKAFNPFKNPLNLFLLALLNNFQPAKI